MSFRIDTAGAGFGSALLLVSITSTQVGSSFAKFLFGMVGPEAAVALRLMTSTLILFAVLRPWRHVPKGSEWKSVALYGLSIAVMNACFYQAISRIPLGIAVAIEFSGPLLVAAASSRRATDFAAVALAVAGLLYRFRLLDELFTGTLSFLRMTPPLALAPLIILWLGIDGAMQVAIIMLASFFPIYLNTRAGLSRLDPLYRELVFR